jgi:hypothetical protein
MNKTNLNVCRYGKKTDKSRKNGQINFRKTNKKRGKDSSRFHKEDEADKERNDSFESRNEQLRPQYCFAKEQFKEIKSENVREFIFGNKFKKEKKQLFKGFYQTILKGKNLSLVEFKEIKQSIDNREIDFKQSDEHYNKVFNEYFQKKQDVLVMEINALISAVIIIYSFE